MSRDERPRPVRGDPQRLQVGCPYCDRSAVLEIWPDQPSDTTVRLVCPNECLLTEHIRDQLLAAITRPS